MARRIAAFDWSASLGPVAQWPQSLKTTVSFMIHCPVALVLLWGEDGIMIYNDAYSEFAGARHPRLLGSKVLEGWPEVADWNANVMKVGMAGGTLSYKDQELSLNRRGTLEPAWIDLDYSPVYAESGKPGGVMAVVVETTERVQVERRKAAEQERQRRLMNRMPAFAAVMAGPEHTYEYVNDAYRELAGERDYVGRSIRQVFPDLADQGYFELLDQVYASGKAHVARAAPVRMNVKGERFVDFVYEPIRDHTGAVTGIFVAGYDVTEARANAEELRAMAHLRSIVETTHIYQGLLDLNGMVLNANTTALSGIDAEAEAVRGEPYWETPWFSGTPGMPEKIREAVRQVAAGDGVQMEMQLNLPIGRRWFEFAMRPLRDERDAVVALVFEAADVTERHQAEDALRQAQKMEAVGQLTGGIAHDFNNLLQGIIGALDRVRHRTAQGRHAETERFVKAAQESANRAAALTHRLLAFSRRQALDPRATDINQLIEGLEELIVRTMGPAVTVTGARAPGLWAARVDPSQLESALLNLCINARDAMPDGGRLTIETRNEQLNEREGAEEQLAPGQYVVLRVTDTGSGMTPEVAARAFDPFFTTKPLGQGTGLGLSMVYGFMRQSGGQARIVSEPGRGTTMALYFPRHMGDAEAVADGADPAVEHGDGETVLVVDDEPVVRMLICEVLAEHGYRVLEAGEGASAMKHLESGERIDLMLTDVGLPGGMNGRQVADAARQLHKDLKVLFITGYAEKAAMGERQLEAGMAILPKPFVMSAMVARVNAMLERAS
jgi:PAS domain S-box-containing protein